MNSEEIIKLQQELAEALELINAIRTGEIDALAVNNAGVSQIFTLQSADQSFRLLVEKMNEGAIVLNKEGNVLYSNSSISNFLEVPLKTLIGSSFFSIIDDEFKEHFRSLFDKGWNGASRGEFMMKNKDGVYVPFYFSLSQIEMGKDPALAIIVTNLSAKNEIKSIRNKVYQQNQIIASKDKELILEKELKKEAEKLAAILEGLPQMAWTANAEGQITYCNQRWFDYTGENSTDKIELSSVLHKEHKEAYFNEWKVSLSSLKSFDIETLIKRNADGMYRWHLVRARPLTNDKSNFWVGTCTDIHDQKQLTDQLAITSVQLINSNKDLTKKNDDLIRINNDLDNFLYVASHDLKSPLSNLEGLINAYFDEIEVDPEHKQMVDMMFTSVNRFKKTILDLTEIAKVNKDEVFEKEIISLEEIYQEVLFDIQELIKRKSPVVTTDFQVNTFPFYRKTIRSLLYNLLSNAIKYSRTNVQPEIHVSSEMNGEQIIIKVRDNGLGLSEENIQKIFKMFNRIHTNEEGSGIGLYIVKRMVKNVGGTIDVKSEVGKGTVFTVIF